MSYQPRPYQAPPWDSSPRPRHEASPPPRHEAPSERRRLGDAWILFWTIVAIAGAIGAVIITVLWPNSSLLLSARSGMEAGMRKILRHTKVGAAALTAVALGLVAGFILGINP